jgi:dolichol-phosphate mannosyltransferase
MKQGSEVGVIIVALNEENGLGPTVTEIFRVLGRPYVLVVDGNSADGTVKVAKELGLDVIVQEGAGKGSALAQGIRYLRVRPRFVVLTDADFTYPAEYVPRMIRILEEKPEVGMVCGDRFDRPFRFGDIHSAYYVGNRLLALAQYVVNGIEMRDPLTGLRVVRWEILRDWKPKSIGFDIEAELNYFVESKGYKIREIPIYYRPRVGEKKLKLKHGFRILARIVTESLMKKG